ncbi:hypothetical protein AAFF_G00074860 [Aldrovandia affinis]|uniref:Uncharacterized protein n=1 Tax=Aldrovandia affinis TaxID=143900 RepID=A0AAD7WDD8_9TELE|nr:hypothetical protein AAFF_G00074860 [Aldrovandia affinis]
MGAVLSWVLVRARALVFDAAAFSGLWSPQEALEDSANDGERLEDRDAGQDPPEWGRRTRDAEDECCDSRSWHSDTSSDLCPDGEDCFSTLPGAEDSYQGWLLENRFHPLECRSRPRERGPHNTVNRIADKTTSEEAGLPLLITTVIPDTAQPPPEEEEALCDCAGVPSLAPLCAAFTEGEGYQQPCLRPLQGSEPEDAAEIHQLISELPGSLSNSREEESEEELVPGTPPLSNPSGQVHVDEGQKACPLSPCGGYEIIHDSGPVDSSTLTSQALLGERRADSAFSLSELEGDHVLLLTLLAHSVESSHSLPEPHTGEFELSDGPVLHSLANEESAPCNLSDISCEISGDPHSNCESNVLSHAELTSATGEASTHTPEHPNESDGSKDTDLFKVDTIQSSASELDDIPVRRIEITLGTHSTLCKQVQSHLVQLELNRVSEERDYTSSDWLSDSNNNTKTPVEPCASSPHTHLLVTVTDQSADHCSEQADGRSQDEEAAKLTALTPRASALQGTLDRDAKPSSSTVEVEDHKPSCRAEDCDNFEGICCEIDQSEVEELERLHQQGVLIDTESTISQDSHAPILTCSHTPILPLYTETCHGDCVEVGNVTRANRISGSQPNLQNSDTESSVGLEYLACYLESRGILLHTAESEEGVQTSDLLPEICGDCVPSGGHSECIQTASQSLEQSVVTGRLSHWEAHLSLPSGNSLEPILELDRSQDNSFVVEDDSSGGEGKGRVNTSREPDSEDRSSTPRHLDNSREDSSSGDSEQQLTSTPDLEYQKAMTPLPNGNMANKRHSSPVSQELDTTSTNSEETDDSPSFLGSNATKVKGTKGSPTSRGSKFSVFSKIPSFRKGKAVAQESKGKKDSQDRVIERGEEVKESMPLYKLHAPFYKSHLSPNTPQLEQQGENSDDEVFSNDNILNQTVERAFGVSKHGHDVEEHGFCPSTPHTRHVRQLYQQGASDGGDAASSPETLLPPEGPGYKRSKSSDSLSLRLRFAQAHKSLSSFFESRAADKENEEEERPRPESERVRAKHTRRKVKRAKEAELLKRGLSVSDADGAKPGHRAQSSSWDTPSPQGSPASLRTSRHTDPLSKKGVPQDSTGDCLRESRSEGRRRRGLPNGLPVGCPSPDSSQPSSDDSDNPEDSGPLSPRSPGSLAALSSQLTPTWDVPLRPMSPKPQSPRLGGQRRSFRYPSSRASTISLILLGQGVSVEGLSDPPEKPKTLKPRATPVVSISSPDTDCQQEDRVDVQNQISLVTSMSVNEFELTQEASKTASLDRRTCDRGKRTLPELGSSSVLQRPRVDSDPSPGARRGVGRRRCCCSDDLWIEEEKNRRRKLAKTAQASLGRLSGQLPGEPEEAHARLSLTAVEAFPSPPKVRCFSQSTPIGLDCLGWRQWISFPSCDTCGPIRAARRPSRCRAAAAAVAAGARVSPGSDSDSSPGVVLGGGLGGSVRGFLSHYWSLESLHSTTGKSGPRARGGQRFERAVRPSVSVATSVSVWGDARLSVSLF